MTIMDMDKMYSAIIPFLHCLVLAVLYVGSLYITKLPFPRDHPKTIKQRIISVIVVCVIGPLYTYYCADFLSYSLIGNFPAMKYFGLHNDNILVALVFPLLLTITLFLGPLFLQLDMDGLSSFTSQICSRDQLDLKWYRTFIVAPFSEELIFRACMLPMLVPNFGLTKSIFIAPMLFGVAHLHHIVEGLKCGQELLPTLLTSCFQMTYTTIFGAYSAFLFLRTGHLIGPVVCHSFCNAMGFPDFEGISSSNHPKTITFLFIFGMLLFSFLLFPLTNPMFYNSIYWK